MQVRKIGRALATQADVINGPASWDTHREALAAYRSLLEALIDAAREELAQTPTVVPR